MPTEGPAFGIDVGVTSLRLAYSDAVDKRPAVRVCPCASLLVCVPCESACLQNCVFGYVPLCVCFFVFLFVYACLGVFGVFFWFVGVSFSLSLPVFICLSPLAPCIDVCVCTPVSHFLPKSFSCKTKILANTYCGATEN